MSPAHTYNLHILSHAVGVVNSATGEWGKYIRQNIGNAQTQYQSIVDEATPGKYMCSVCEGLAPGTVSRYVCTAIVGKDLTRHSRISSWLADTELKL